MNNKLRESCVDRLEENLIALLLGLMTLVTFANVIARKAFNYNILWGLELTVFLFGWLVLLGASYAVKKGAHLGVDVVINSVSPPMRRWLALVAVGVCIAFACLLLKGSYDYWANFANLPATEGRWFPVGFQNKYLSKGWYEVTDIPNPFFLNWLASVFNEGEPYEKLPRLIPYAVLPLSMALLLLRFTQLMVVVWRGNKDRAIVSHEVADEIQHIRELHSNKKQ